MNKKKILMYNGETESYYGCDNPKVLSEGKLYEIIAETDVCGCQTNYSLKGVEGKFNSVWFNEPKGNFAYSSTIPVEGEPMRNFITFVGIDAKAIKHTSPVHYVEQIASDIYKVYTKNTLYIVKVSNETSLYVVKAIRKES